MYDQIRHEENQSLEGEKIELHQVFPLPLHEFADMYEKICQSLVSEFQCGLPFVPR